MTQHHWIINPRRFEVTHGFSFDGPEVKTVSSFETSGSYYTLTQRRIPKEQNPQPFCSGNLKTRIFKPLTFCSPILSYRVSLSAGRK